MLGLNVGPGRTNKSSAFNRSASERSLRSAEPFANGGEPSLEDLLTDPVTKAIMSCDHVSNASLRSLVKETRVVLMERTNH